jgi:hypothetical protein
MATIDKVREHGGKEDKRLGVQYSNNVPLSNNMDIARPLRFAFGHGAGVFVTMTQRFEAEP